MKIIHTVIFSLALLSLSCASDVSFDSSHQQLGGANVWPPPAWPQNAWPPDSWPPVTQPPAAWPPGCQLCGTNSPIVDGVAFYELALDQHTLNDQKVRLGKVRNALDETVTLKTKRDRLYGQPEGGGLKALKVGSIISVHRWSDELNDDVEYELHIVEIGKTAHWVDKEGLPANTYRMKYSIPGEGDREFDVCPDVPASLPSSAIPHHFVAFSGDRFDATDKTVAATAADAKGWLNFACWGSSIFKMHMNRHTSASATKTHTSSWAERQAMLKMYTADYCGDGTPHTVTGQPLSYTDDAGWLPPMAPIASIEAVWDENGAACLTVPRLAAWDDISCAQALHECPIDFAAAQELGHLFSGNPL